MPPGTDLVVLDPPRTGAAGAARSIAGSKVKRVVYVACDPPTLARDLATLTSANYRINDVEIVELFPQTSHVETLVHLVRVKG
jgi:23S rRNA (uracil1939-C5)-methyltransferase